MLEFWTDIEIYAMLLAQKPAHVMVLRRVATLLAEDEVHRNEDVASRSRLCFYLALAAFPDNILLVITPPKSPLYCWHPARQSLTLLLTE